MKLFEPAKISGMELKNRIIFPPMVSRRADLSGYVTEDMKKFYVSIARGGVGLLVIEATYTYGIPTILGLYDDQHIPGFKAMVDQIHSETDTKVTIQINEALPRIVNVEEVTLEHIERFYDRYVKTAVRAKKAGFDGVEIHGAHCYIIASFLSLRNKRKDEYGKTLDGRMKLLRTVFLRIKDECGKDFPVGVRIDGDECIVGGNTLQQTTKIAAKLAEWGLAYLSISAGGKNEDGVRHPATGCISPYSDIGPWNTEVMGYSGHRAMPPAYMPDGVNVYLSAEIKKVVEPFNLPVITAGKIPTPEFAESILEENKADLVGVCRPILCDPEWPKKAKEGRSREILRCVYCCRCMEDLRIGRPVSCQRWKEGKKQTGKETESALLSNLEEV
jgi:2,4-dienoyl-CoA reductase-like NADH-dependent reductase (Old Yellow Enzyme family)